jgi:hypothetical protein
MENFNNKSDFQIMNDNTDFERNTYQILFKQFETEKFRKTLLERSNINLKPASSFIPGLYDAPGNVYFLVGMARRLSRQLGMNEEFIVEHMRSGDEKHMIRVFDLYFTGKVSENSFRTNS